MIWGESPLFLETPKCVKPNTSDLLDFFWEDMRRFDLEFFVYLGELQ